MDSFIFMLLLLSSLTSIGVFIYLLKLRKVSGALSLALLMAALAEYSLMYAIELIIPDLETKLLIAKIEYIGIVTFPVLWFSFAERYIKLENKTPISSSKIVILSILPAITLILAWTNEYHNAVWNSASLQINSGYQILTWNHGFWFWIHISYAYLLILAGAVVLVSRIRYDKTKYHGQTILIISGLLVPFFFNVMYMLGYAIGPVLDPTPLAFTVTGIIFAVNIRVYDFFQIMPIAQHTIVENLDDGIIVLDLNNLIIDSNPAAQAIFSQPLEKMMGKEITSFNNLQAEEYKPLLETQEGKTEIQIYKGNILQYYIVRLKSLFNNQKQKIGSIIVIQDITSHKQNEQNKLLMHELNHRTKNNLMMISSLVQMKTHALGGSSELSDLIHQIDTIRLVYEKLSFYGDVSSVKLKNYIQSILITVFGASTKQVSIENMIGDISLNIQTALPLGLIVNEMATNAVKYGFIPEKTLIFNVTLTKDSSKKQFLMSISNSGNPFPDYIDFKSTNTMGLKLISSLTKQIYGSIELQRNPHPEFLLRFPFDKEVE